MIRRSDLATKVFQLHDPDDVGYGDIVPRSPAARTLTILEAIMGQFYLVALVGRLVGLHIVRERSTLTRLTVSPPKIRDQDHVGPNKPIVMV